EAKRAEARKHYGEGESKFASGDYAGAYDAYKAANDLIPAPQTLYKMAVSLDKGGKAEDAVTAYNTFLAANPPASMEPKSTDAQARIVELKKSILVTVKVKTDPTGALLTVDGEQQVGTTPMDVKLSVGKHKVRATSNGYDPAERDLEVTSAMDPVTITLV